MATNNAYFFLGKAIAERHENVVNIQGKPNIKEKLFEKWFVKLLEKWYKEQQQINNYFYFCSEQYSERWGDSGLDGNERSDIRQGSIGQGSIGWGSNEPQSIYQWPHKPRMMQP